MMLTRTRTALLCLDMGPDMETLDFDSTLMLVLLIFPTNLDRLGLCLTIVVKQIYRLMSWLLVSGLDTETMDSVIQALVHVVLHVSVDGGAAELYHAVPKHNLGHACVIIMIRKICQTCLQNL